MIVVYRNNAPSEGGEHTPADPFSVRIDVPSHAKKGELLPFRITTESHLDRTVYVSYSCVLLLLFPFVCWRFMIFISTHLYIFYCFVLFSW